MIDLSPEEFLQLGYRAVDLIAEQLVVLGDAPVRQPVPTELRERLMHAPLNTEPIEPALLLEQAAELVLAYPMGNASPRFFGWVNSPPAPFAVLAEMLAAAHNASVAGGDHAATYVEHGVLNWLKPIFGFSSESGGLLVSGGSVANLIGLATMRYVKTQGSVRARGFYDESAPMVIYTSTQGHSCVQKQLSCSALAATLCAKSP